MEQMEQWNKRRKTVKGLWNKSYFDSEVGYSIFFPQKDDVDLQAYVKQWIHILKNAQTCAN